MTDSVLELMRVSPVIPVIVVNKLEEAIPLASALVAGGLRVLEVTLRTEYGIEAINKIAAGVPGAIVGAGTVTREDDVGAVVGAGAQFMVSPGFTPKLIESALKEDIKLLPGVSTPSEVMRLREYGLTQMKFFPAEASGGIPMLKSIYGPLADITFCPTGGININSAKNYLSLANVACVGGSWMLPNNEIESKNWGRIEQLAHEAASLSSQ